nr:nucleotide-diphospho-sugar transferase [uncultured Dyadobacter sp.]
MKTLFRESNRGCGHGPAEAITWFFDHVEEGIILEDDCLPDERFFPFCAELLERYRTNEQIAMISGTNFLGQWKANRQSYLFSALGGTWGWASWRRAWNYFDYSAAAWNTAEGKWRVAETLGRKSFFRHYAQEFDFYFKEQRRDVWDFQWYFSRLYHRGYSIVPTVNLISNIGFDGDGTHTFGAKSPFFLMPAYALPFPLKHTDIEIDQFYDWYLFERFINPEKRSLWKRIILKVVKLATKS